MPEEDLLKKIQDEIRLLRNISNTNANNLSMLFSNDPMAMKRYSRMKSLSHNNILKFKSNLYQHIDKQIDVKQKTKPHSKKNVTKFISKNNVPIIYESSEIGQSHAIIRENHVSAQGRGRIIFNRGSFLSNNSAMSSQNLSLSNMHSHLRKSDKDESPIQNTKHEKLQSIDLAPKNQINHEGFKLGTSYSIKINDDNSTKNQKKVRGFANLEISRKVVQLDCSKIHCIHNKSNNSLNEEYIQEKYEIQKLISFSFKNTNLKNNP